MMTPNTYPLNEKTFVDTYGFFRLRKEDEFEMVVSDYFNRGKLKTYKGKRVKLIRIGNKRYGDIIEIVNLGAAKQQENEILNIIDFKHKSDRFYSIPEWNKEKVLEGQKLFEFLRSFNPIYFQRSKEWKKKYIETSKTGDYFILQVRGERGSLKKINECTCLIVATYNKGYKNGFMAIPLK